MADLTKWSPFEDVWRMRDNFNRLINFLSPGAETNEQGWKDAWRPSVDVHENDDTVHVSAEIPGVNPDDLDIIVTDENLTIRGEVKQETTTDEHGYKRIERRYGSFQRTIPFPVTVKHDLANAQYEDGILKITVPKAEPSKTKAFRLKVSNNKRPPLQ